MEGLLLTLVLDSTLAILLFTTIIFCSKLNTRIRILQDSKSDLSRLIKQFDETTQRATGSIVELQAATKKIGENIQHKIDKANFLADDLSFMIEKGSKIADQMEGGFASNRKAGSAAERPKPNVNVQQQQAPAPARPPVRAEAAAPTPRNAAQGTTQAKTNASIESVLERMATRGGASEDAASGKRAPSARIRSKAEQELFDALKTGR